jgi:hypothetical protein
VVVVALQRQHLVRVDRAAEVQVALMSATQLLMELLAHQEQVLAAEVERITDQVVLAEPVALVF